MIVVITAVFALVLAFVLGMALGFFRDFFAVPHDPAIDRIREVLPGANCGACGFPGCDSYAAAVAAGSAGPALCTAGGPAVAEKIAAITGVSGGAVEQTVTVLACQGSQIHAGLKGTYTGLRTCRGAKISAGGTKLCSWGCMGFGDCVKVCKFNALAMGENGLPIVDYAKCTGCQVCVRECPQGILQNVPKNRKGAVVLCSNKNPIRQRVIKTCKIACLKCGLCVRNCPRQCISLDTFIPIVDYSKCDSCGTCVTKCPSKVFKIIEKDILPA
jgi:Na+-translocating ferredoxin:NAD+ oxidoreductase RNF subunit RnfB